IPTPPPRTRPRGGFVVSGRPPMTEDPKPALVENMVLLRKDDFEELLRIPAMADTRSGDDGQHRSVATQVGGLSIRLSVMLQGRAFLAHRLSGGEFDAMPRMHEPVEYGVSQAPTAQVLVPVADG